MCPPTSCGYSRSLPLPVFLAMLVAWGSTWRSPPGPRECITLRSSIGFSGKAWAPGRGEEVGEPLPCLGLGLKHPYLGGDGDRLPLD